MNRLRLPVVACTALAVVLGGATSASAGHTPRDEDPEIIRVGNARADDKHPDTLSVRVVYVCDSKREEGTLELTLEQWLKDSRYKKAIYEGEADATCDGRRQNDWVELERVEREKGKRLGFAENGHAWLDVTLTESGRKGDSVEDSFRVQVRGAGWR
jgi:hypothetical protein